MQSFDFLADLHCRRDEAGVFARVEWPFHEVRLCRLVVLICCGCGASNVRDRLAERLGGLSELHFVTELLRLVGLSFSNWCSAIGRLL